MEERGQSKMSPFQHILDFPSLFLNNSPSLVSHFLRYISPSSLVTFEGKRVLEAGVVFHGCWRHYGRSFILKHKS